MIYAQEIVEYANMLADKCGTTFTSLTGFEPTLNVMVVIGGIIFLVRYLVFKL